MAITLEPIWEGDSLPVKVTVLDSGGPARKDLTGATIEMSAESDGTVVNAAISEDDLVQGEFTGQFAPGVLWFGQWYIQARVTLVGEVTTVGDATVTVQKSNFV